MVVICMARSNRCNSQLAVRVRLFLGKTGTFKNTTFYSKSTCWWSKWCGRRTSRTLRRSPAGTHSRTPVGTTAGQADVFVEKGERELLREQPSGACYSHAVR